MRSRHVECWLLWAVCAALLGACSRRPLSPGTEQRSQGDVGDGDDEANIDSGSACLPYQCPTGRLWSQQLCSCMAVDASASADVGAEAPACLSLPCPTDRPWNEQLCTCTAIDAGAVDAGAVDAGAVDAGVCLPYSCPTDRPWSQKLCTCAVVNADTCLPYPCPTDHQWRQALCGCVQD
jgi:hypothetical protein